MSASANLTAGTAAAAPISVEVRLAIEDLYAEYAACLDEGRYDAWPLFFVADCIYKIIPRENFERGLPLCTILAESRGMLEDRVTAINQAMLFKPHYWRHLITGFRMVRSDDGAIAVQASYLVIRTQPDEPSEVFQAGRYQDLIVRDGGQWRFKEKLCIFDSLLINNSLILPI